MEITKGSNARLIATVKPDNAEDKSVTWQSDNSDVVSVNSGGYIHARSVGTATITATTSNGLSATCTVTVKAKQPQSIELSKTSLEIYITQSEQLTATVKPDDAEDKTVTWTSDDPNIAEVDQNGKVTPKSLGTTNIRVTASNGVNAQCTVTVKDDIKTKFSFGGFEGTFYYSGKFVISGNGELSAENFDEIAENIDTVNVTSIVFGSGITSLKNFEFILFSNLKEVYFEGDKPTMNENFDGRTITVYFPEGNETWNDIQNNWAGGGEVEKFESYNP